MKPGARAKTRQQKKTPERRSRVKWLLPVIGCLLLLLPLQGQALQKISFASEGDGGVLKVSRRDVNLIKFPVEDVEVYTRSKIAEVKVNKVVLSEGMYELLKSVHTDSGNYSEIFVYSPMGIAIGRLSVDRFTQLLYSTKAEEYARVKEVVARGRTLVEAIRGIIEGEKKKA